MPTFTRQVAGEVAVANDVNELQVVLEQLTAYVAAKTGAYAIATTDRIVPANCAAGGFTFTLPSAVTFGAGNELVIPKIDTSVNALTIATTSSQTIDGNTSATLYGRVSVTLASDGANWIVVQGKQYVNPEAFNVHWFGAKGDGTTDDTTAIQTAIDVAATRGGGYVHLIDLSYKVTSLTLKVGVTLRGVGMRAATLLGTAGSDIIVLPTAGGNSMFGLENVQLSGGRRGIAYTAGATADYCTYVRLHNVEITGPSSECVYTEGDIEEWYFDTVRLSGGTYGFRHANVDSADGNNYVDKCTFKDVLTAGQSINGWRIDGKTGANLTWINPIVNTAGQHGIVIDGGWRSLVFINLNTEGNGSTGKNQRTTGSITSGTAVLTVASSTGYTAGDPIVVQGAGANGIDLFTTISTVDSATQLTLAVNASTTVSSAKVTNASYDEVSISTSIATPGRIMFIGGTLGGEGSGGKLRYAIDNRSAIDISLINVHVGGSGTNAIPVYDPSFRCSAFGGSLDQRQPSGVAALVARGSTFPGSGANREAARTLISSPPGKPLTLMLSDSNENGSGTLSVFEVRRFDSNRMLLFSVDGTSKDVIQERGDAKLTIRGALDHDGTTVGFFGVTPAARPAAYTASNVTADRAYDANATTVDELADVLGTLIADLRSLGLVQ